MSPGESEEGETKRRKNGIYSKDLGTWSSSEDHE